MREWRPIETQPLDGSQIELLMSGGTTCQAPSLPPQEIDTATRLKLAKQGRWPDHRRFTATHWRPIEE